jgi:ubiquinone/menaquinone biosynthesis C-methylase UbiE
MMKLHHIFKPVSVREEREFERENVARKATRYLEANPLDRYASDQAYREKVDRIRAAVDGIRGHILDIGGNTAGEAIILAQSGFRFTVGDINQLALDLSRQRVEKFGLTKPNYAALDVHNLPFADGSFDAVTVIEALHHFLDYEKSLLEICRVLKPGGKLFSLEPYALNPLRRLAEIRERFRGTIEKSFYIGQLRRLCPAAGFERVSVELLPAMRTSWKVAEVPAYRRPVTRLHGWLSCRYPGLFGTLRVECFKPGMAKAPAVSDVPWHALLRSPVNGESVAFDPARKLWVETSGGRGFPDLRGIPVLIADDAVVLAPDDSPDERR